MPNIPVPTRAELQAFIPDQRTVRAVEALFKAARPAPGGIVYTAAESCAGALPADGAAVDRVMYADLMAALIRTSTVTITIASPGVVTWAAHGLANSVPLVLSNKGGALPTGLVAGTTYYTKAVAANTFQLSATAGGAAINTSGTQSGVHTATAWPFGIGDGVTTFNVPTVAAVGGCSAFVVY
jgi:hypothetical protein